MISKPILRELIKHRYRDAEILFAEKRYHSSFYMGGYAVEIALKYKICKMYYFSQGFPENKVEFQSYIVNAKKKKLLLNTIKSVQEIRHHDLPKLLLYSGSEVKVKSKVLDEWNLIAGWNPEMRYSIASINKAQGQNKLSAIKAVLSEIYK